MFFFPNLSTFSDPLDLTDHPLLLDMFSQGPPSSVLDWVYLFFFKASFEKPSSARTQGFKALFLLKNYSLTENTIRWPNSVLRDTARTDDDRARELWLHTIICP